MIFPTHIQPVAPISDAILADMKKHLPPAMRKEVEKRQAEIKAKEAERERREEIKLSQVLDSELLMRFAYVPFVVANLAWDYADSILLTVQVMKIDATKKLCRAVKQLKRDYDRIRSEYVNSAHSQSEEDNMYVFEDGVHDILKLYFVNIEADIRSAYPDLKEDYIILLKAVYECHIILQCIYEYVKKISEKVEQIVGHKIGDVLPPQLRRLDTLVLAFVGDKPITDKFAKQQKTYAQTLANRMFLIDLNEVKDE